jgi:hypothetical protein
MKLYKTSFNWYGQSFVFHTYAVSKERAFSNGCEQLAKKLKVNSTTVKTYFRGTEKFKVEEIPVKAKELKENLDELLCIHRIFLER